MKLDYSSLESALASLERSHHYLHSELSRENPELREQFRTATIKGFEFTYEVAINMIRRQLSQILASPESIRRKDFADLMRDAFDAGLISDPRSFVRYRELRNKTAHTYNIESTENTVIEMDSFLRDIRFLLDQLRKYNRETD